MRRVIVSVLLLVATGVSAQPCDVPAGYANVAYVQEGDIRVGFATDKLTYKPGEPIHYYLVVQNLGAAQWSVNWGVDPQNVFFVTEDSYNSIDDPGFWDNAAYIYPSVIYYFSVGTTLDPGQCRIWDETTLYPIEYPTPANGQYHVFGGMASVTFTDVATIAWEMPSTGIMLTINVDSSVAAEETTWGRIKALYE